MYLIDFKQKWIFIDWSDRMKMLNADRFQVIRVCLCVYISIIALSLKLSSNIYNNEIDTLLVCVCVWFVSKLIGRVRIHAILLL